MQLFRKVLFWSHLITGVAVALIVLIMSVTGVLLTYELQMTYWADTHKLEGAAPEADMKRMGAGQLVAMMEEAEGTRPTSLKWMKGEDEPVMVSFGRSNTLYANAYTGEVLGGQSERIRTFFREVMYWHRWLAMSGDDREIGKAITGASNLGFLFLILSGLYLWFPRKLRRNTVRAVIWFRKGLSPKARDFNWHNVIGFWSFVPLVFVVATATVFSYSWASDLVYILAGESPPEGRRGGGEMSEEEEIVDPFSLDESLYESLEGLWGPVEERMEDWKAISLTVPKNFEENLSMRVYGGTSRQPQKQATLTVDRATGQEVEWTGFDANSPGRQARIFIRFAHTGEVFGFWGQTIAGLVSLGSVFLVWTGIALSLRRFSAWRRRRRDAKARVEV